MRQCTTVRVLLTLSVIAVVGLFPWKVLGQDIVERAEATELRSSDGTPTPRVERDEAGNVISLRLNSMELRPGDAEALSQLKHLRRLCLYETNANDEDVEALTRITHLEHLNLTSTKITDASVDSILKFGELKSVCLGLVDVTPDAIEKIHERNRLQGREGRVLRFGYSRRQNEPQ